MEEKKKYKGKILLFGEYSVINGSGALAIPTDLFSGFWDFDEGIAKSQGILYDLHTYLSTLTFDNVVYQVEQFKQDLDRFLIFNSSIPIGYGAGSSGAVCAAIFDQYFQKDNQLTLSQLKQILGKMESFFHGSSSGLDPLICYLDQAIIIQNETTKITPIPLYKNTCQLFLLDTGFPRRTEPLVQLYLEKYKSDEKFRAAIQEDLALLNNQAIQQFIDKKETELFNSFGKISDFQWKYFEEMIPTSIRPVWEEGLTSAHFKLKLCGAGGGGFLLGMTRNWQASTAALKNWQTHLLS